MLPTKGYFQDIECPFNNTTCGRPYCHFRHKRKPNETVEDTVQETPQNVVPTYKPTPKSELANIHNNKSHIPISYVPDLAFKRERTIRPLPRIEKPTYNPTPLSILSSANKLDTSLPDNHEHKETIKDIQENIASNVYDPLKSEIDFEDLSNEFDLIDDIINDTDVEPSSSINDNLIKLKSDIKKQQNKLNLLQSGLSTNEPENKESEITVKTEINVDGEGHVDDKVVVKKEKVEEKSSDKDKKDKKSSEKKDKRSEKELKSASKNKSSNKHKIKDKNSSSKDNLNKDREKKSGQAECVSKSHKSSEREKHRKEEKKNSAKESREKGKHKSRARSKSPKDSKNDKKKSKHTSESGSNSESVSKDTKKGKHRTDSSGFESVSSDISVDQKANKKEKKSSKKRKSVERSINKYKDKERKTSTSRSRSRSVSKSKESKSKHKSSRSREKDKEIKHKSREKDKARTKSSSKDKDGQSRAKKPHDIRKEKRKKSTSESNVSQFGNDSDTYQPEDHSSVPEDLIPSDIDLDLEDEDETMRECYKIFNEYTPTPIQRAPKVEDPERKDLFEEDLYSGKKRTAHAGADISSSYSKLPPPPKPKAVPLPGQILTNRYRVAQKAQGSNEQENIMNEVLNITRQPTKRPATSLLEAARQHKIKKLQQQRLKEKERAGDVVDRILNGTHAPSQSQVKVAPKKIAAVPNVALIEKARERISLIKQQRMQNVKTVAQTQKGGRKAHVPEYSLSDIPDVLQADKSKLPVNVRTRFLTMIVEECSKLYALKEDAYNRALNEEFACYEKCKVLTTYRNSAMLAVNRLRKEIQDREAKGLGRLLSGETATTEKESDFKGRRFYENVRKWILTEEELDLHGYPKESETRGKAMINNQKEIDYSIADDSYRKCSRCSRVYQVDDDGWPLYEEECMYHPLKKRTIRREQVFLCCKSSDDTGCAMSDTHVCDGLKEHLLEGYQTTLPPASDDDPRNIAVYALDCEMCYTTKGLELTRVTIVDIDSKTVYESLVKPLNPIIDYNTRFSGITKDQMDRTSTSILQIQANILHLCNSETILVGHSLESDMKALKIVHGTVIDTSVLFPHKMGLPQKRALRALASEYLKKIIQNDVSGHDSAEDAVTCMELIKWKLKEELKTRTK